MKKLIKDDIQVIGIIQEQHPQRCRLYMQWKQLDFPILVDAYNLLGLTTVPMSFSVDERGVVRQVLHSPAQLELRPTDTGEPIPPEPPAPHVTALRRHVAAATDAKGHAALLRWLEQRVAEAPDDAAALFALGVALRMRSESEAREPDDFQDAVAAWQRALDLKPNQYIWRRRIQQYGPRLTKPYAFYDWITTAQQEIRERGETPFELLVPLTHSERADRARFRPAAEQSEPDPQDRITTDAAPLIELETTVVPNRIKPDSMTRVHLHLRPRAGVGHWNNEAGPGQVFVEAPAGWQLGRALAELPHRADQATSDELRAVEFELKAPAEPAADARLKGYVLYYVCTDDDGTCLYRRQDFEVALPAVK